MNRVFHLLNFLGIFVLAVLCAMQWNVNRRAHQQVVDLQSTNDQQRDTIDNQSKTIRGQLADLDDFRHRLTQVNADLSITQEKLANITVQRDRLAADRDKLTAERDQLRSGIAKWSAAVAARDALIKQASKEIEQLGQQRNDAILRFNDLVAKYNALAKESTQATR